MEDFTRKIMIKDGDPDCGEPFFDATLDIIDLTTGDGIETLGPDDNGWYEYTINSELEGHELMIRASHDDRETVELEGLLIPDDVPEDNYQIVLNPITPPGPTPQEINVVGMGDKFSLKVCIELQGK